ncbi:MAG: XamI family restriction endonuclease [Burkholderiaceae bacterium]|nr:MAG: XamI family restriction endonuclease [Burkholderiaceae bacterium]TAM00395.1 MAG: XamI family restriction endonuclease [Pusillimonas sp.]
MSVNLDKPHLWKDDIARSVDMYNKWFMRFAPEAFRTTRMQTAKSVETALKATANLTNIKPELLQQHPDVLPTLRMSTCPPIAVDRLIGLAGVLPSLVKSMELHKRFPRKLTTADLVYTPSESAMGASG